MENRAMLIGSVGAGKSTLTNALLGEQKQAAKTQSLHYAGWIVDTPGEYTENPLFYKNIMATSLEVTHILFLQDATGDKMIFPPQFSSGIPKLPVGVVTKADHPDAKVADAIERLKQVIIKGPIVITSAVNGTGVSHIKALAAMNSLEEMKAYALKQQDGMIIFHDSLYK